MSTPQASTEVEAAIGPTLDKFVTSCEPMLRKVSEDVYEQLLNTVQDYLRNNAAWNIGAEIDRCRAIERKNVELSDANANLIALAHQYRNDLLYPPAPDSRDRRLAAIDAAIKKAMAA